MAIPSQAERITKLEAWTHTFDERVENAKTDIDELSEDLKKDVDRKISDCSHALARLERDFRHNEQELERLRLGRYDLGKLVIAAVLGGGMTFVFGQINEWQKSFYAQRQIQAAKP